MYDSNSGQRIGPFTVGMAVTALFAILAWWSFLLLTMMMNPALAGADYWAAVGDRARSNPVVAVFLGLCCLGVVGGAVLMGRAVVSRFERQAAPVAAPDPTREELIG